MRYRIVVTGRSSRGPFGAAIGRYLERLRALAGEAVLVELKESRAGTVAERRGADGAALLAAAQGRTVVLDERGTARTTMGLVDHVERLAVGGTSRLSLLVGGADGVDGAVVDAADEAWSLSPLTLAHELALAVLLEALVRVESVRAGHPYHRA